MKTATILGIALLMLGVVAFAYQGITYTTREKVIDLGPLQATVDTKQTIPLTPLVGGLALVGGIGCWSLEPGECSKATFFSSGMLHIMGSVSMHRAL